MPHALLLTGTPGVGKTTVIIRLAEYLPDRRIRGFVTEEIRDRRGRREGFLARPFGGGDVTIASVHRWGSPRVGRYGVDIGALDALAERYLEPTEDVDLYLVDEIGKMECFSNSFVKAMTRLLDGPKPLLATIGLRGTGLVAEAKKWPGTELWRVTRENRDELPRRALLWLDAGGHL
jgi:nucleoside-triphosphatase